MLDISSKLPKHVIVKIPRDDGGEVPCPVDVEYEWLPPKCTICQSLGHKNAECPDMRRQPTPAVHVFVPKNLPPHQVICDPDHSQTRDLASRTREPRDHPSSRQNEESKGNEVVVSSTPDEAGPSRMAEGKEIVIYNAFDALLLDDENAENSARGPNRTGSRIWLAWDDDFVGIDVLDVDAQYVHCRVLIHCIHTHVLMTIVYGVNDLGGRRVLWQHLSNISCLIDDIPWLVGGDFNTVLDSSEVCGQSGDIRSAAEDFQACLHDTGLINLPMQGEWFTWHNYSSDTRSLWKKLDRILVNDSWLGTWPNSFYASLNARTSDHSPLVLGGNVPF
ncbi:UNVERIFIED_CONTAM: hypothetical protein Slati_3080000 [Sesamum latifolium]|uniref:Uncharacterized protein n=1 Tax=Sesamum latifolium TaxID=2727402 RepID=A0AAW2UWW7_9LAMI